jgi:hypothetical protein
MLAWKKCVFVGLVMLVAASAPGQEACQERTLDLRFSPPAGGARNWCWAATGEMTMAHLGDHSSNACQCRQAEQVLGVKGCCLTPGSCLPADDLPARCDAPRWPAFVENPEQYTFSYVTTCDGLAERQDDEACVAKPIGWKALTAEICAGRPVIASLRPSPGSAKGHTIVVRGFSLHGHRGSHPGSDEALPS